MRVPVELKLAVSLLLKLKPACVPVSGVFSLSCSVCHWKPKVMLWFPLIQSRLFCTSTVFLASLKAWELVPSQLTGALLPLKLISGKPEPATPPGRPVSPAFDGYSPPYVLLVKGINNRLSDTLNWFTTVGVMM